MNSAESTLCSKCLLMQVAIYWVGVSFESRFPLKIKSQSFLRLFLFSAFMGNNRSPHTCG